CREYRVEVTVTDVRTLAAATGLEPGEFITLSENEPGQPGFRLRPGGQGYALNLRKRAATGGCVFLMEIAEGHARCGVYAHRPNVCRTFPTTAQRGAVAIRPDVLCGPGLWSLAAMDVPGYRRCHERKDADWAAHWATVAGWNDLV